MIQIQDFKNCVLAYIKQEFTLMESILQVCEDKKIEPEDVRPLITGNMKERLAVEARELNMLEPLNQATLDDLFE